ncbi:MAG TPA: hypothetical protein VEH31_31370 [Streptosporangiaceae bacterium]|nr:hypothetical protein [Streptosporangiaceae bacterium]
MSRAAAGLLSASEVIGRFTGWARHRVRTARHPNWPGGNVHALAAAALL